MLLNNLKLKKKLDNNKDCHKQEARVKELLAIRRIFSLVDMITNTKLSNGPNVFFKIGVVQQ